MVNRLLLRRMDAGATNRTIDHVAHVCAKRTLVIDFRFVDPARDSFPLIGAHSLAGSHGDTLICFSADPDSCLFEIVRVEPLAFFAKSTLHNFSARRNDISQTTIDLLIRRSEPGTSGHCDFTGKIAESLPWVH